MIRIYDLLELTVDNIDQSTFAQPAFGPSAPSAPQPDFSGPIVGTITEVTVTQPSQPLINPEICPICRIGNYIYTYRIHLKYL